MSDAVVLCADATAEGGQLAEALRARGYRVVESTTAGVVSSASGRSIALLVLDSDDSLALGTLAAFRALPRNAAVPVVLIAGAGSAIHDLTSAVEAGADALLTRPIPIDRAVRKVETYLGRPAPRPASRPADVWDSADAVAAIPPAPRVPHEAQASSAPATREPTRVTDRRAATPSSVAPSAREPTQLSGRRTPAASRAAPASGAPAEPAPPASTRPDVAAAPGERDVLGETHDEGDEPVRVQVSRTFVLSSQQASPARPPDSIDAPPPAVRERTLVLSAAKPAKVAAREQPDAQPPAAAGEPTEDEPPDRPFAPPAPPSLALAFAPEEPASDPGPSGRVLLSRDLQDAIDAADRRLFDAAPTLAPLFAPTDENVEALVSHDIIDGLRQPLEIEERYEAHDAWTVLGEARASTGRPSRADATGEAAPATGPAPASEPVGSATEPPRPSAPPSGPPPAPTPSQPPGAPTGTELSLRSDERALRQLRPRTGMLDARGLLPVLASCLRRRVDGRLTLRGMEGSVSLFLSAGKIVCARTDRRSRGLAWLLLRERRIDQASARELDLEAERSGRGMGTVLLARGLVPGDDLEALERRYQEELVVEAIGDSARAGFFELVEGELVLPGGPLLDRPTVALAVAALRRRVEPKDALARLGGAGARLRAVLPIARVLRDAALLPLEERALRALGERSVGELVETLGLEVLPALHVLEQLGILELEGGTARARAEPPPHELTPAVPTPAAPTPPVPIARGEPSSAPRLVPRRRDDRPREGRRARRAESTTASEQARALVERAAALADDGDYFSILGLAHDASRADIRNAYARRRRQLSGLDLDALGLTNLREARSVAIEILDEAFAVLRDDELRDRYRGALVRAAVTG